MRRCVADHNGAMNASLSTLVAPRLHTILGANGVIGRELSRVLASSGQRVRQVSRHPLAVPVESACVLPLAWSSFSWLNR